MPGAVKTARDEKLWSKAKAAARKKFTEGSDRFYKYAMGIYKKMKGKDMPKTMMVKARIATHQRKTKTGKVVTVREHQAARKRGPAKPSKEQIAERSKKIAGIIEDQIGSKALTMIGAKMLMHGTDEDGNAYLQFKIGTNPKKVNVVKVTRNKSDTYDIEYGNMSMRTLDYKVKSSEKGVQVDSLNDSIQRNTGLTTSLGSMGEKTPSSVKITPSGVSGYLRQAGFPISNPDKPSTFPEKKSGIYSTKHMGDVYIQYNDSEKKGDRVEVMKRAKASLNRGGLDITEVKAGNGIFRVHLHSRIQKHKVKKSIEGTTMDKSKYPLMQKAVDSTESIKVSAGLEEFPQMQKAVESGSMSKSVKFYKKGSEIKQSILAKIERCKIEITALKAGIKAKPEVDASGMADVTKDDIETVEPWEIRSKRRDITRLQTVADNIDVSKKFELNEYELNDYGF